MTERVAVVVFNLGGPDRPEAVEPFLFNLFRDPAIIGAPLPIRWALARVISRRRAPVAREIYAHLGGRSPLLELTRAQASALEAGLVKAGLDARVFVCMRYWHPMSAAVAADVAAWNPDRVVLLPLYPQYSMTTSGSSIADWRAAATAAGLNGPETTICCYFTEAGLAEAHAGLIRKALNEVAADGQKPRVLFSAHGLPKRVIRRGDPYQWQVEQTVATVVTAIGDPHLEHVICYQSRVGPLEWIGPGTEVEIDRAGADGVPVVVVPIAFVSEHSETLVELDIEYRSRALEAGVPSYVRVPAVGTDPAFIGGLIRLVSEALSRPAGTAPHGGLRLCPAERSRCPCDLSA